MNTIVQQIYVINLVGSVEKLSFTFWSLDAGSAYIRRGTEDELIDDNAYGSRVGSSHLRHFITIKSYQVYCDSHILFLLGYAIMK